MTRLTESECKQALLLIGERLRTNLFVTQVDFVDIIKEVRR